MLQCRYEGSSQTFAPKGKLPDVTLESELHKEKAEAATLTLWLRQREHESETLRQEQCGREGGSSKALC